jgi:outer membrane protein
VTATRIKTVASQGRSAVTQSVLSPSVSLTYLLFDFGERSGNVGAARNALLAANYTHNATLQSVVLQIQAAYFQYIANRALLQAQSITVKEARTNLQAAEERRRVGVATIADVLQARTAASQAELAAETTEGDLQTSRGALALSLGIPANLPYDIDSAAGQLPVSTLSDSVETLIGEAVRRRPDLAAAQAEFAASRSQISVARAARLPSLTLNGTGGRTWTSSLPQGGNNYTVSLGLRIPLFAGFSRIYDQREATALADAAQARAQLLGQQVVFQVFSSYHALQTAARRVSTAQDLIASAEQSNEVALARYRSGVGSVLDLLSAQTALADARAQQVLARLEWNTSLAQLAHDAGLLDQRGGTSLRLNPDTTQTRPQ